MDAHLDRELKQLILGTNDQRRRVGQAVFHLYKTLVFWHDKGRPFSASVRAWSVGGAAVFDSLAATLEGLDRFDEDERLRRWLAEVLGQLAEDLARGDHMLVPFLRWVESRFPELTEMMRAESAGSKIYDFALARSLTALFARAANLERTDLAAALGKGASDLLTPVRPASPRS